MDFGTVRFRNPYFRMQEMPVRPLPIVARKKPFPWHIVVFLAPAVLIYTVFMIYPLADSLRLSFFTQDARNVEAFAGLQNYVRLLTDGEWAPRFWNALQNNLIFFAVHML